MRKITLDVDFELNFETAFEIADKHLRQAVQEGDSLGPYVTISMIEAAVNAAVDRVESWVVTDILRDLATQVEHETKMPPADFC